MRFWRYLKISLFHWKSYCKRVIIEHLCYIPGAKRVIFEKSPFWKITLLKNHPFEKAPFSVYYLLFLGRIYTRMNRLISMIKAIKFIYGKGFDIFTVIKWLFGDLLPCSVFAENVSKNITVKSWYYYCKVFLLLL